ncbi:MAG: L,D-transpeptidase family protein [Candidatus Eremiobacterota bacterium]
MRKVLIAILLLAWVVPALATPPPLDGSRQAVVVLTESWRARKGTLTRYERSSSGAWLRVGGSLPVIVGRNGMAWGLGLHPTPEAPERVKREGDGCAPAGVFRLTSLFGFGQAPPPAHALPYTELTSDTAGVDDPDSRHYNRIVRPGPDVVRDWKSAERMRIPDYRVGIVVDHNPEPLKGAGSCIFMHLWVAPDVPTSGCTATSYSNMRMLADWLRRDAHPALVQMPREAYARYREPWGLP